MRKGMSLAAGPLAAAVMLALSNAPVGAQEDPYLSQGGGEIRVMRGLEPEKDFESATLPQATEEPQAAATEARAEPELTPSEAEPGLTPSAAEAEVFGMAKGRWMSQRQTHRGETTKTIKTTFDVYGKMASIPGPDANFYTVDENGIWEGYWVEDSGRQRCATQYDGRNHWGVIQLQFDPTYTRFEGTWDYCGEGHKWEWRGTRFGH